MLDSCGDPIEKSPCVAEARLKSLATPTVYIGYKKLKQMPFWLQNQTLRPVFVPLLELKPDSLVLHLFVLISLQNYNVFVTLQNYNVFIFNAVFRFRISGR